MNFQCEPLFDVIDEVQPLLELHYTELTLNKERIKLNPRWDVYADLERLGMFVVFTARDDERLVGYSAFFINRNMHYADLTVAQNDVFYVAEEYRTGFAALRLIRYTERALKELGAHKIIYHCKLTNKFAPVLHALKYKDEEVMTAKLL